LIYSFIVSNPVEDIGSIAMTDLEDFIQRYVGQKYAIGGRQQSSQVNAITDHRSIKYHDFLEIIAPMN
jgi:hypothetical protein